MKTTIPALLTSGVVALCACGSARDTSGSSATGQTGSAFCFSCHSETTTLGFEIQWAQFGYETSVHALGQIERIYTQTVTGACPAFAATAACTGAGGSVAGGLCTVPNATQASCTAAGGTWIAPVLTGQQCFGPAGGAPAGTPALQQACTAGGGTVAGAGASATCTVTGVSTQNGCETAGGSWVGPRWTYTTVEHTGSNAFYSNASGCQMCHTQEGFRKRINKQYDSPSYNSIQFAWDPRAFVGTPTSPAGQNTPLTADVIVKPSPLACFGCHNPHSEGTPDGITLTQAIPPGTAITTQVGNIYGNTTTGQPKAKGHLCSECHQIAFNSSAASVTEAIAGIAKGSGTGTTLTLRGTEGPHHGPQTDMLLGKGGAEYTGSATAPGGGTFTFAGSYASSHHTTDPNADCVSCHMQSDTSDINLTGRFAVSPAVGGHAFTNKGAVHGQETVLAVGCGSTTHDANGNLTSSCHTVTGVTGSTGSVITPSRFTTSLGYLQTGDAFYKKTGSTYEQQMNELLTKLANPSNACEGLISAAARKSGGLKAWSPLSDGSTVDPRCLDAGATGIAKDANPADNNTSNTVRFVKAIWNFKLVLVEDKSFGVHNTKYALQLLYDTCADLALMTQATNPCGASTGGSCDFCNGVFVTGRPQ
jgi:hypothetical protein